MPTYTVTAPNGKSLDVTGDHVPSEAELHEIFAKAGVDAAGPPSTAAPTQPPSSALSSYWQAHPKTKQVVSGVVNTLPAVGAVAGGIAASPETLGAGSIAGGAVGAGAGRGLRDLVAEHLQLEPETSPVGKAARIGLDTAIAAASPAAAEWVKDLFTQPKTIVADVLDIIGSPSKTLKGVSQWLRTPNATGPVLARPGWQETNVAPVDVEPYQPNVSGYGGPGSAGRMAARPVPTTATVEQFAPNTSGYGGAGSAGRAPAGPMPTTPFSRYAPNVSSTPDMGVPSGPMPTTPFSRYAPNVSSTPDMGVPSGPMPTAATIERFAPNASGYTGAAGAEAPGTAIAGLHVPQATFAKIGDEWGIVGRGLKEGETANVVSSSGVPRLVRVGKVMVDQGGVQAAKVTDVHVPEAEVKKLMDQGVSRGDAVRHIYNDLVGSR